MFNLVDLSQVEIESASAIPVRTLNLHGRVLEQYEVKASLGGVYVAMITIERALNMTGRPSDQIFLDFGKQPPVPNPIVSYQKTEKGYRGEGIIGRVIVLADNLYREVFEKPLCSYPHTRDSERRAPQRVWKKLEAQGLARYEPCEFRDATRTKVLDRWVLV